MKERPIFSARMANSNNEGKKMNIDDMTIKQMREHLATAEQIRKTLSLPAPAEEPAPAIGGYVILRCQKAGVHAGELVSVGDLVELRNSRRIWYWSGAASLSELAVYGAKNPGECKFAAKIERLQLPIADVGEIIYCKPAGRMMIEAQPEWRA